MDGVWGGLCEWGIDLISDDVTIPTADCANVEDIGGSFEATIVGYSTCYQFINEINRNGLNAIVFPIFYDIFINSATKLRERCAKNCSGY